jgi:3-dehydroquinate dehydratase
MKVVEARVRQLDMIKTEMHLSNIRATENIRTKLTRAVEEVKRED